MLPVEAVRFVPERMALHGFDELPVGIAHALRASGLPDIHADPFDRLLVAQSQIDDLPLITSDPAIERYDVDVIW
jgi:PIN domain nuclease of toxin-antitoxin system